MGSDEARAVFRFDPRSSRPERDEVGRFELAHAQALRVALAWRVSFTLRWVPGARGGVYLDVAGRIARAWVQRVLEPAYGRAGWRPVARGTSAGRGRATLYARRSAGGLTPLAGPSEAGVGRWSDIVAAGLGVLPEGVHLDWRFAPGATPSAADVVRPALVLQPLPERHRALPISAPERVALDVAIAHRWQPQWAITGTIESDGTGGPDAAGRLAALIGEASRAPGRAGLAFSPRRGFWRPGGPAIPASEEEVAAIFPAPWTRMTGSGGATPGREAPDGLQLSPPAAAPALPFDPGQGRHLLVLGETGMGKSTLLLTLAARAARHGSVVLFDPIGDSARRFAALLGPMDRERTVLIAPVSSPIGVNAVPAADARRGRPESWTERARDDLVGALRRVRSARYEESAFWGPRLDELATLAIGAAARFPRATLLDVERILDAAGGRLGPVPPEARLAVDELRRRVADRPDEVDGTRRLFAEITRHAALRRMLCEPSPRWSLDEALASHRVVVICGEAPAAGEAVARSLLAVHLALLWSQVIARPRTSKVFLVLDEVQWYAHESLGEMLRLGRRFNLHVWAATQALSRLAPELRDALLTNCADIVAFRGSPDEAREFARWSSLVRAEDLASLGVGQALLMIDKGRSVGWLPGNRPLCPRSSEAAAWEEIAAASDHWLVPEAPVLARASDTDAPGTGPSHDAVRELLVVLWAGLLSVDPEPTLRVSLAGLRGAADPQGRAVRELGRRLADAGVRVDSGRDDEGRFWTIRRTGFDLLLAPGVAPEELAGAEAVWRRVLGESGEPPPARKSH